MKSLLDKYIARVKKSESEADEIRTRKFPQTSLMAILVIMVAVVIYLSPRYEVVEHQSIQVPAWSFHNYAINLSEPNEIGVEIQSIQEQPFDFYILPTEEFELLKSYIINGKDPNREINYSYRETNVKKINLRHFPLEMGPYTLVMDNSYYDTEGSEENLMLDFKILRKTGGIF